jgi:hypothetical protein
MARGCVTRRLVTLLSITGLVACSFWALDPYYVAMFRAPWGESWWTVLPDTLGAAGRVWGFWGLATVIVAGLLFRHTTIGVFDAVLLGALTLWVGSWVLGTLLGPFGLLGARFLWGLLVAGAVALVLRPPSRPQLAWTPGLRLTALTAALVLPPLFLEQLGSPVPPYMDVFSPLAAAQRIVTFGYAPFDNDPYGYYGRAAGMPGVELFYAVLTLGSGVSTASLAATATMVPMAALLMLAAYRLGKTLVGDRCGGFATLLLMGTMVFRVLPYGHGRYLAFIPALAGLAYVVDRHPVRRVAGGLLLGTAVACHAIIGGFAMVTALAGGLPFLVGASVLTLPTALVAVGPPLPLLVLSAIHAVGVLLLVATALSWAPPTIWGVSWVTAIIGRGALLALAALIVIHPPATLLAGFVECWRFPVVLPLAAVGTVVLACTRAPARRILLTVLCTVGVGAAVLSSSVRIPGLPSYAGSELEWKAEFWIPVMLCFPAAAGLAWAARWSVRAVAVPLVALLVVPWVSPVATALNLAPCIQVAVRDPNYNAISWSEAVGQYLLVAKSGYFNPRRAQTPAEQQLSALLRDEVNAGRITAATHIVHLSPYIYLYRDNVLFSVFVGINDDLFVADYTYEPSTAGGRFRPIAEAVTVLTQRPAYVVIHERMTDGRTLNEAFVQALPLAGYEVLMDDDGVRLLRWRNA